MNGFDIILLIIIIGSFIRGFQLGLVRQVIHLLGFVIAIYMAYRFSGDLSPYLQQYIPAPSFENSSLRMFSQSFQIQNMFYNAIAFLLIFVLTKILLNILGHILHQIANLPGLAVINRFSGGIIGILQALIIIFIVVHVITVMPWQSIQHYVEGSTIANFMVNMTPIVTEKIYQLWNTTIQI